MQLKTVAAFIKKDFLTQESYRFFFAFNIAGIFVPMAIIYFISKSFDTRSDYFSNYGGRYLPFVFIGLVIHSYLLNALQGLSLKIRREQLLGTLEAIISTPISSGSLILGLISWDFLRGTINIFIYIIIGMFFFNLHSKLIGLLSTLVVLIFGLFSLVGLGIISASFTLYFKREDPVNWLGVTLFGFLGGVFFPTEILPPVLQKISYFIPLTHVLKALRLSLLSGYSLSSLKDIIIILMLFSVVLVPVSLVIFNLALRKTLREGIRIY